MPCSSGCPTQDHATWGECVRSKSLQVADVTAHKFNSGIYRQQDNYMNARNAGLQPESPFKKDVDFAWKQTEKNGVPYRADNPASIPRKD